MNSRWALVLLFAWACPRAAAEMLQFSGECRYSLVDQEGKLEHRTARTFTATIDGCRWRIRTAQSGTNGPRWGNSPYVYMEEANGAADSLVVTRLWDQTKLPPVDGLRIAKSVTVTWGT